MFHNVYSSVSGKGFCKMNKTSRLLILSVAFLPIAAMAETYKCRAPDGKVSYSGQMSSTPGVKCEQMFVKKPPVSRSEAPPPAEPPAESAQNKASAPPPDDDTADPAIAAAAKAKAQAEAEAQKTPADKELEAKRKKAEAEAANKNTNESKQAELKQKEEKCGNAKASYQTYQQGGRIRKTSETGETTYLSDAEVKQGLEQAKQEMDKWCGS